MRKCNCQLVGWYSCVQSLVGCGSTHGCQVIRGPRSSRAAVIGRVEKHLVGWLSRGKIRAEPVRIDREPIEGCARAKVERSRLRPRLLSNALFVLVQKETEEVKPRTVSVR